MNNNIKTNNIKTNNIKIMFENIPIFWINLNDSLDRCNKIKTQLNNYNNNYRIEAIDGRNKINFFNNYNIKYTDEYNYTASVLAVSCSHIKAIKQGYDCGYEMICVFEDDVDFELIPHYPHTLKEIISIAPNDWEIIQLYHNDKLINDLNFYKNNGLMVFKPAKYYSGTCYLINKKGMAKILKEVVEVININTYNFLINGIEPEKVLFSILNYYVLNFPFLHFGSSVPTFDKYFNNDNNCKKECQKLHCEIKNNLKDFILNLTKENKSK